MGDFNDLYSNEEKWRGRIRQEWSFFDFRQFIQENQLIDIGFEGNPWTWCNQWQDGETRQRLDRGLSSGASSNLFEQPKCTHVESLASDHSMLILDTNSGKGGRERSFSLTKDGSSEKGWGR